MLRVSEVIEPEMSIDSLNLRWVTPVSGITEELVHWGHFVRTPAILIHPRAPCHEPGGEEY